LRFEEVSIRLLKCSDLKISQKLDYAVRALAFLAKNHDGVRLFRTEEISDEEKVPLPFLSLIFHELKKAGFLISKRGKAGGWRLSRTAEEITLLQVVEALEPDLLNYLGGNPGGSSVVVEACWREVQGSARDQLEAMTLESITKPPREAMFYI